MSKIDGKLFTAFTAEISQSNQKKLREAIRDTVEWKNTRLEVSDIADRLNSKLRGWIGYYGLYSNKCLRLVLLQVDIRLVRWMRKKYRLGYRKGTAYLSLLKEQHPKLFYHWEAGYC